MAEKNMSNDEFFIIKHLHFDVACDIMRQTTSKITGQTQKTGTEENASSDGKSECYKVKITMYEPENIKIEFQSEPLRDKHMTTYSKKSCGAYEKKSMVFVKDAADYLVELFKNTNERYCCSTIKLGKLLTLAAFLYACKPGEEGSKLFIEDIVSLNCGATVNNIDFYWLDYSGGIDTSNKIQESSIDEISNTSNLEQEICDILRYVFCNFGAFSQQVLGRYIDSYKPEGIGEYSIIDVHDLSIDVLSKRVIDGLPNQLEGLAKYAQEYWKSRNG